MVIIKGAFHRLCSSSGVPLSLFKQLFNGSMALEELSKVWKNDSKDVFSVISIWPWDLKYLFESLCYKLKVWSWKKWAFFSILGNVGSSIFGTTPKLQTYSEDISTSAALILIILSLLCGPKLHGSAVANHWSASLRQTTSQADILSVTVSRTSLLWSV